MNQSSFVRDAGATGQRVGPRRRRSLLGLGVRLRPRLKAEGLRKPGIFIQKWGAADPTNGFTISRPYEPNEKMWGRPHMPQVSVRTVGRGASRINAEVWLQHTADLILLLYLNYILFPIGGVGVLDGYSLRYED